MGRADILWVIRYNLMTEKTIYEMPPSIQESGIGTRSLEKPVSILFYFNWETLNTCGLDPSAMTSIVDHHHNHNYHIFLDLFLVLLLNHVPFPVGGARVDLN